MSKTETLKAIESADITQQDWSYVIVDGITNQFARGYLSSKLEDLGNCLSLNTEEYREELLDFAKHDIWK